MTDFEARPDQPIADADLIVDDEAAAAVIRVNVLGYRKVYAGSSKKHPKDGPDPRIGGMLALARAFARAAADLEASANRKVRFQERLRQNRRFRGSFKPGDVRLNIPDVSLRTLLDDDFVGGRR